MFTKDKLVGKGQYQVTKKVTDWEAVFATIFWVGVGLFLLVKCAG